VVKNSLVDSCNFGYEKVGVLCQQFAAISRAELEQSSIAPGAKNVLTVRLQSNVGVPQGATVKIKNLLGVTTPTGTIQWNTVGSTEKQNAAWDQASGILSITVPKEFAASASLDIEFTVSNPSVASARSIEVEISGWPANTGLVISKVMSVLRVCPVGFFGNDCAYRCFGTVINKGCRCAEGQFGFDCSQKPEKDTANSVAPVAVAAGVAADVKSASGVGVSLPAGALAIGVTIEVAIYDIDVKISSEQPGATISPAGAIGVFLPHGQKFLVPVTITLKYDPSKVPDGDGVFIYYFDEDLNPPIWTQMPGKVWVFAFDIALHMCPRKC
jgi:hypothetical protein